MGVANAFAYGAGWRGNDADEEAAAASLTRDGVAAAFEPAELLAVCEVEAKGEGDGCGTERVDSVAATTPGAGVAANVGDAGGDARSIGLASVPRLLVA